MVGHMRHPAFVAFAASLLLAPAASAGTVEVDNGADCFCSVTYVGARVEANVVTMDATADTVTIRDAAAPVRERSSACASGQPAATRPRRCDGRCACADSVADCR